MMHYQETEQATYAGAATPVQIRDLATVTSTIAVPDSFDILDLDVALTITHTCDGDLDVYLIGPNGTRVQLFADLLTCDDNFTGTILDDEATAVLTNGGAPYSGRFRPQGVLSSFDGIDASGNWSLEITDDTRRNTGTLNSWSLTFSRSATAAPAAAAVFAAASRSVGEFSGGRAATAVVAAAPRREAVRLQSAAVDQAVSQRLLAGDDLRSRRIQASRSRLVRLGNEPASTQVRANGTTGP